MFKPSAEILNHVVTENGQELISWKLNIHRFVLSEFNTHRGFSRNSASSRAVPIGKMIELALNSDVKPVEWGLNCKGMSSKEVIADDTILEDVEYEWKRARIMAVDAAKRLAEMNVHKQIVNRILEPFLPHTIIATSNEINLKHFIQLRTAVDAQPEIRAVALEMEKAYMYSKKKLIRPEQVYTPFGILEFETLNGTEVPDDKTGLIENKFMFSPPIYSAVAKCARISYLKHEENSDEEKDENLFWKLYKSGHLSPFEHVALYDPENTIAHRVLIPGSVLKKSNFDNDFIQMRKFVELNL